MDIQPDFTEQEIFQALRWGTDDKTAADKARILSDVTPGPLQNENGPGIAYRSIPTVTFSDDFLALLSFVSEDARKRAEQLMLERHGGHFSAEQRTAWEKKRAELHAALVKAGKLPE